MLHLFLAVIQLAEGAPAPLDLHAVHPCPHGDTADDVVVCGSTGRDRYRLRPLPDRYAPPAREGLPRAEVPLGGGTVGLSAQQGDVGGVASNRVMLGWKLKF